MLACRGGRKALSVDLESSHLALSIDCSLKFLSRCSTDLKSIMRIILACRGRRKALNIDLESSRRALSIDCSVKVKY